jgi:hypothetical protein
MRRHGFGLHSYISCQLPFAGTVKGENTSVDEVGYILKKNSYDRPESLEMNFQTMLLILKWETTYQLFFSG